MGEGVERARQNGPPAAGPGARALAAALSACGFVLWGASACAAQSAKWVFPGASWQEKTPEQAGVERAKLAAFRTNICGKTPERSGGCVIKDGYLIYAWGNYTKPRNWFSAFKPCLSTMLFAAIAEGKVEGPDSRIARYWPALRPSDQTMTFRHLADNTSGYACADKDQAGRPLPPSSRWAYNDYAIKLYLRTLDKVFGTTDGLVAASHQRFAVPLQFQDGEFLNSSPRDFARAGWFWLNKGYWKGKQLLPGGLFEKYVKADVPLNMPRTLTPNKPPFDDYLGMGPSGGGINQGDGQGIYGFNWWYNRCLTVPPREPPLLAWPSAPADTFMALGRAGRDGMAMFPSLGLVVAAYNDAKPTWGDAVVTDPPDSNNKLNRNLRLLAEAVSRR